MQYQKDAILSARDVQSSGQTHYSIAVQNCHIWYRPWLVNNNNSPSSNNDQVSQTTDISHPQRRRTDQAR